MTTVDCRICRLTPFFIQEKIKCKHIYKKYISIYM